MFVSRDLKCTGCGHEWNGLVDTSPGWGSAELETVVEICPGCSKRKEQLIELGGLKHREVINDFSTDPRDYRDCVKISGLQVTKDGEPVLHAKNGTPMNKQPRFLPDATAARRDEFHFNQDKQRGTRPLYFGTETK